MFFTCEQQVRTDDSSFLLTHQKSTRIFFGLTMTISAWMCLKERTSSPRGPLTVTIFLSTLTVTEQVL